MGFYKYPKSSFDACGKITKTSSLLSSLLLLLLLLSLLLLLLLIIFNCLEK